MAESGSLVPIVKKFIDNDTVRAAHYLESLSDEDALLVLDSLPPTLSIKILRFVQPGHATSLLSRISEKSFSNISRKMDSQLASRLLISLSSDARKLFLEKIPDEVKQELKEMLYYPNDSVGRIMTTEFIAFHSNLKAKEAIQKIRQLVRKEYPASYLYVIDSEHHLMGIINMRDLLLASPDATLESILRSNVFTVKAFTKVEVVIAELGKRRFFAVPVVDSENRLLGIVRTEQLISEAQDEATEDIQKMFGAGGDERVFSPVRYSLRKRLPWLHVNLATAFLAAAVVAFFEDIIAKVTILAVFLPVVAGQGGNAGAQSFAVVMRGLVMREIPSKQIKKLIFKETWMGLVNGVVIGLVTALIAWLWGSNPFLGLVIGMAMIVNLTAAGFSGAVIPLAMKAIGFDPAQSSSIILTTVTDVVGFLSFLGFALLFQNYLI